MLYQDAFDTAVRRSGVCLSKLDTKSAGIGGTLPPQSPDELQKM
jgi:hypothetical protein